MRRFGFPCFESLESSVHCIETADQPGESLLQMLELIRYGRVWVGFRRLRERTVDVHAFVVGVGSDVQAFAHCLKTLPLRPEFRRFEFQADHEQNGAT